MAIISLDSIREDIARAVIEEDHPGYTAGRGVHYVVADEDGDHPRVVFKEDSQLPPWGRNSIVIPVRDALTKEADSADFFEDDADDDDLIIFAMTYVRKSIRV